MPQLLKEALGQDDADRESPREQQRVSEPVPEGPVEQEEALEMMEYAVNQLTEKLNARVVRVTGKALA